MIELRSDTFTLPTPTMLKAIVEAPLGNDGYREDPTVIELEKLVASRLAKEAACLMPSGTMANLASIMACCSPGKNEAIVGDLSDIYAYEGGGAAYAGVTYCALPNQPDGTIRIADVECQLGTASSPNARAGLLCLENPHNLCGGVILPLDYVRSISEIVRSRRIHLHLDGARVFNAAVASGVEPADIVKYADSVQFCLSKGLAAPVGSIVAGDAPFIQTIRSIRKILGGTMRQAGIIAAAGIVALNQMVNRLAEDHRNARRLAEGLAMFPGIEVNLNTVQTNTVVFRVKDSRFNCKSFIASAWSRGVHISEFKDDRVRAVLHYGITAEDVDKTLRILLQTLTNGPAQHVPYCAIADG
jgi:threonine aldolase